MYPDWIQQLLDSGVQLTTGQTAERVLQYVQSTDDKKLYKRLFMSEFQQETDLNKGGPGSGRRTEVSRAKDNVNKLKTQLDETKGKLDALNAKEQRVKDLQSKKDAATSKREAAEKKIAESKARIAELKSRLNKAEAMPIGTIRNGRRKVADGKWVADEKVGQAETTKQVKDKPMKRKEEKKVDHKEEHNKEEAQRHMSEALKYNDLNSKLKEGIKARKKIDPNYKVPAKAQELLDQTKAKSGVHKADYGMKKSLISVDDQGSAVETANFNKDLEMSMDHVDRFLKVMEGYDYGDAPRTIELDGGYSIILSKVDDGLYSGFVRQTVDWDGDSPLEETVGKVEKQTIPTIISYLKAKEFIRPVSYELAEALNNVATAATSEEIGVAYAEAMEEAGRELDRQEQIAEADVAKEAMLEDRALASKLINLLDRLI